MLRFACTNGMLCNSRHCTPDVQSGTALPLTLAIARLREFRLSGGSRFFPGQSPTICGSFPLHRWHLHHTCTTPYGCTLVPVGRRSATRWSSGLNFSHPPLPLGVCKGCGFPHRVLVCSTDVVGEAAIGLGVLSRVWLLNIFSTDSFRFGPQSLSFNPGFQTFTKCLQFCKLWFLSEVII
jgi:hypothetical protein